MDLEQIKVQDELARSRKGVGIAYFLWFFLGTLGAHRFYIGRPVSGIIYLLLTLAGCLLWFPFILVGFGLIYDAFTLPGRVAKCNERASARIFRKYEKKKD